MSRAILLNVFIMLFTNIFLSQASEVKLNEAQMQEILKQISDNQGKLSPKILQSFSDEM